MKKLMMTALMVLSVTALGAKKPKAEPVIPDVQTQMERADKIESYRSKKDVAWHKTEYNKVLKYLNKKK
ncbi:MAG: hypothetical protein KBF12_11380 [Sebaldella sp.]|nr:hypothetical protein [Sebaldella sp.]